MVVRFTDGSILKGTSGNFRPNCTEFHVRDRSTGEPVEVRVDDLKAVFFVHDFDGDADNRGRADVDRAGLGKKVQVDFEDGETLIGYTSGYAPGRPAFWVHPADPSSNNDRCYVITSATTAVTFLE